MAEALDWHLARALLEWQVELGVTEAILSQPQDRLAAPSTGQANPAAAPEPGPLAPAVDPATLATRRAAAARTLTDLAEALASFDGCDLRRGAMSCVFADGNPAARVMIVGEIPSLDEDRLGRPFVGRPGQLLDLMFAAIGLSRSSPDPAASLYVTNAVPWRPPGDRKPTREELAMLRPFLLRHIELSKPDVLVLMGSVASEALLGQSSILRSRGAWTQVAGIEALPMLNPTYLLKTPAAKREAWADLLTLQARLRP